MFNSLRSAMQGLREVTAWVSRAEAKIERVVQSHPKEAESTTNAAAMSLFPIVQIGKLIWKAADPVGSANRFADNIESSVKGTLSWQMGTSTLVDMPRF